VTINYSYSEGDLLRDPQTYRYASFQGEPFVDAWQASRQAACNTLPAPRLLALRAMPECDCTDSAAWLAQLCLSLRTAAVDESAQYWLPRLLKKFEVSKRLYAGYERAAPHRALPGSDFLALRPYLLLAEAMVHGWRAQRAGYYLSGLLKITDTLISQQARLLNDEAAYMAWILEQEQQLIAELRP